MYTGDETKASIRVPDPNTTPGENREMGTASRGMKQLIDNDALLFRKLTEDAPAAAQSPAADGNLALANGLAAITGLARVRILAPVAAAAGESVVAKVRVDGAVPAQAGVTVDEDSDASVWYAGPYDVKVTEGQALTVNVDYTAGGAPTPLDNLLYKIDIIPAQ